MAKKTKKTTAELILEKHEEIKNQTELLNELNAELKELQEVKLQEDKDDIYKLVQTTGFTKEEVEKVLTQLANKRIETNQKAS